MMKLTIGMPEMEDDDGRYTHRTAHHLAQSRPRIRSHEEIEEARIREPEPDEGVSFREKLDRSYLHGGR